VQAIATTGEEARHRHACRSPLLMSHRAQADGTSTDPRGDAMDKAINRAVAPAPAA
jgi:hypothetical protein